MLALLGQLLAHHLALQRREVIDEQLAVQVIHLVLDADGQQAVGPQLLRLALAVEEAHGDLVGAVHVGEDAGHGQAAFLVHLFAGLVAQLRIDEDLGLVLFLADVDDHEALVHVHLAGGQADARRVVHGLEHVVEQALEFGRRHICGLHRHGLGAQAGVGEFEDGEQGHGTSRDGGASGIRQGLTNSNAGACVAPGFLDYSADHLSGNQVDTAMFKCFRTVFAVAVLTVGTYAAAAEMAGGHPDTYVVKRGDTLWDISARFLKKPWLWPEIWQANPQIQNPHLIYPGDVISLAYLDRVAVQPGPREEAPLNAIPLSDIEPFLKDRRVVDSFEGLPHVAGLDEDRLRGSGGHNIYVRGLDGAQPGQRFTVVRPSARFTDNPRSQDLDFRGRTIRGEVDMWKDITEQTGKGAFLGYELVKVNVATFTRGVVPGTEVSTLVADIGGHEIRVGDRLIPVDAQPYDLHFFPHPPARDPAGKLRVLAVADALTSGGPRDVIAISGGRLDGVDNGTVFSIWRNGSHTANRMAHPESSRISESPKSGAGRVSLPDEYASHAMVFRTFDKVSYALVMEGVEATRVGYELKHPDATY